MVEIDETEDENDGWPKVTENQTNHVVNLVPRSHSVLPLAVGDLGTRLPRCRNRDQPSCHGHGKSFNT